MSGLRDKQPERKEFDFSKTTFGSDTFRARLHVWTYSSIRSEDVYAPHVEVLFRADGIRSALGFSEAIGAVLGEVHDVWATGVDGVWKVRQ